MQAFIYFSCIYKLACNTVLVGLGAPDVPTGTFSFENIEALPEKVCRESYPFRSRFQLETQPAKRFGFSQVEQRRHYLSFQFYRVPMGVVSN